jgi:hypothetical protein
VVVGNESDKFWEVISIPFSYTHGEEIDIFVELIEESNGLDYHVVYTVDVELQFGPRVGMTKPELSFGEIVRLESLQKLWGM